jgi:HD-GYP domain-containing protein (c-di-GMP phosphodiesterase class II)
MSRELLSYVRSIHPSIACLGVYWHENGAFRLMESEAGSAKWKDEEARPVLDQYAVPGAAHEERGRLHIYTTFPENRKTAIRVISYTPIPTPGIEYELRYISALLESVTECERMKGELVQTRLLLESKSFFSSPQFNLEEYVLFMAGIIHKAYHFDTVRIIFPDRETVMGKGDTPRESGKTLHVRNTGISVVIDRSSGVTREDIVNTGRFLDVLSAIFAMYSSETNILNYTDFLDAAIRVFEQSDIFYRDHSKMVDVVARAIATSLSLDEKRLKGLGYACRFHDIGMLGDIYTIALKNIDLSEKEHARIKFHPLIGYAITMPMDSLYPISGTILQHHELLDGSGYPNGVSPDTILLESRILAFSEVFIGALSDRPHRKGRSFSDAVREVEAMAPHKLDRDVLRAFVEMRESIERELDALKRHTPETAG